MTTRQKSKVVAALDDSARVHDASLQRSIDIATSPGSMDGV